MTTEELFELKELLKDAKYCCNTYDCAIQSSILTINAISNGADIVIRAVLTHIVVACAAIMLLKYFPSNYNAEIFTCATMAVCLFWIYKAKHIKQRAINETIKRNELCVYNYAINISEGWIARYVACNESSVYNRDEDLKIIYDDLVCILFLPAEHEKVMNYLTIVYDNFIGIHHEPGYKYSDETKLFHNGTDNE